MVQPCIWFKEEPSQFSMGQTAQSLTCSIRDKLHTGLDECPRIILSCFRARNSGALFNFQLKDKKQTFCRCLFVLEALENQLQPPPSLVQKPTLQ